MKVLELNKIRPYFFDLKPFRRYRKLLFYKNFSNYFFLKENFDFNFFKFENFSMFNSYFNFRTNNLTLFRLFLFKFRRMMRHF